MAKIKFNCIVIHYDEIGLKGKNRSYFEQMLIRNIKAKLNNSIASCKRETGQITLDLNPKANISKVKDILSKIPGLAYFSQFWPLPVPALDDHKVLKGGNVRAFTMVRMWVKDRVSNVNFVEMYVPTMREIEAAVPKRPYATIRQIVHRRLLHVNMRLLGCCLLVHAATHIGSGLCAMKPSTTPGKSPRTRRWL